MDDDFQEALEDLINQEVVRRVNETLKAWWRDHEDEISAHLWMPAAGYGGLRLSVKFPGGLLAYGNGSFDIDLNERDWVFTDMLRALDVEGGGDYVPTQQREAAAELREIADLLEGSLKDSDDFSLLGCRCFSNRRIVAPKSASS